MDKTKDKSVQTAAAAMGGDAPPPKKKAKRSFSQAGWTAKDDMLMLTRVQRFVEGVPDAGLDWFITCSARAIEARRVARREQMIGQAREVTRGVVEGPTPPMTSLGLV